MLGKVQKQLYTVQATEQNFIKEINKLRLKINSRLAIGVNVSLGKDLRLWCLTVSMKRSGSGLSPALSTNFRWFV